MLLESCNGDVARIRKSLERPGCDFGIRLDEGLMAEVTGIHRALFAGRLLTVAALYELCQGHLETAVDDVELSEMSHKSQPAWLAAEIRLVNVVDGLYWQGHDRALAEGWLLALGAACDKIGSSERTNPLTGKPYRLTVGEMSVTVLGVSDDDGDWKTAEPLTVPRLAQLARRGPRLR